VPRCASAASNICTSDSFCESTIVMLRWFEPQQHRVEGKGWRERKGASFAATLLTPTPALSPSSPNGRTTTKP
jgi:hypothetical protein